MMTTPGVLVSKDSLVCSACVCARVSVGGEGKERRRRHHVIPDAGLRPSCLSCSLSLTRECVRAPGACCRAACAVAQDSQQTQERVAAACDLLIMKRHEAGENGGREGEEAEKGRRGAGNEMRGNSSSRTSACFRQEMKGRQKSAREAAAAAAATTTTAREGQKQRREWMGRTFSFALPLPSSLDSSLRFSSAVLSASCEILLLSSLV